MVISWVLVETLVEFNGDLSGFSGDLMGFWNGIVVEFSADLVQI
jgi:hypothetical protein